MMPILLAKETPTLSLTTEDPDPVFHSPIRTISFGNWQDTDCSAIIALSVDGCCTAALDCENNIVDRTAAIRSPIQSNQDNLVSRKMRIVRQERLRTPSRCDTSFKVSADTTPGSMATENVI